MAQQKKPKRDKRQLLTAIFAGFLVLLMILPMLTMIFQSATAATATEIKGSISGLQGDAANLAARIKKLNDELKAIAGDKSKALQQKSNLDQQTSAKEAEISNTEALIVQYEALIAERQLNLDDTKSKEAIQFKTFCQRVRAMEEAGTVSYWSILFQSADFADLLDRATFVSEVMEYDNQVMDDLAATRKKIEDIMTELVATQNEQQSLRDNLMVQKKELDGKLATAADLVKKIKSQEAEYQSSRDALKKEEAQVEAQIKKKQKELAAKMASGSIKFDPGTGWQWPLAGHYNITSLFGNRPHPLTGKPNNHTGTDIGAPRNTPIHSARGGVVTISTYNNSYGNYVVVDHGDSTATLYAHMNSRSVKEGQIVSQGQTLGLVGSTGSSTGNHLHFEVRVNGGRRDALNYYGGIAGNFTYS